MGHALRQHRRRKLLGLGHEHLATLLTVQEHLRHLRALPRACAPADEHDFVLLDRSQYVPPTSIGRQVCGIPHPRAADATAPPANTDVTPAAAPHLRTPREVNR